jgi:hypothetical protein
LIKIAKRAKKTGLTPEEAEILREWAEEFEIEFRGPESHEKGTIGKEPHYHCGSPKSHSGTTMKATFYDDTRELIVYADCDELWELGERLRDPAGSTILLEPEVDTEDSAVEMRVLHISPSGDGAVVSVDADEAKITGSDAGLTRLSRLIEALDDGDWNDPGAHAHFEPDDGRPVRFFLSPGSCALIMAGPIPDEPVPET